MSEAFLGELRIFSFSFAPRGWAQCNGQLLPINQNQALFAILGTTFGGNGQTNFGLPDLRGRVPIHWGLGTILGERAGEEAHTLNTNELPAHIHLMQASTTSANTPSPTVLSRTGNLYGDPNSLTVLGAAAPNGPSIAPVGGSQPHQNMMPYGVLNICIALIGIFPSQN